jgi:4'-phosphopantetheinyl transferase EntD
MAFDGAFELAFDLALEHGRAVGVVIPDAPEAVDALAATLPGPERARAFELPMARRRTYTGGRVAMHAALGRLGVRVDTVASDERGAPVLPPGVAGSITHKERLAAALVAFEASARLGVDLEMDAPRRQDIASRVLRDSEREELAGLGELERGREVLLRFSAKEAVYKALDPYVRRYVDFKEVAVSPRPDGTAAVAMHLRSRGDRLDGGDRADRDEAGPEGEGPFAVAVGWRRFDGVVLTTARVDRVRGAG